MVWVRSVMILTSMPMGSKPENGAVRHRIDRIRAWLALDAQDDGRLADVCPGSPLPPPRQRRRWRVIQANRRAVSPCDDERMIVLGPAQLIIIFECTLVWDRSTFPSEH